MDEELDPVTTVRTDAKRERVTKDGYQFEFRLAFMPSFPNLRVADFGVRFLVESGVASGGYWLGCQFARRTERFEIQNARMSFDAIPRQRVTREPIHDENTSGHVCKVNVNPSINPEVDALIHVNYMSRVARGRKEENCTLRLRVVISRIPGTADPSPPRQTTPEFDGRSLEEIRRRMDSIIARLEPLPRVEQHAGAIDEKLAGLHEQVQSLNAATERIQRFLRTLAPLDPDLLKSRLERWFKRHAESKILQVQLAGGGSVDRATGPWRAYEQALAVVRRGCPSRDRLLAMCPDMAAEIDSLEQRIQTIGEGIERSGEIIDLPAVKAKTFEEFLESEYLDRFMSEPRISTEIEAYRQYLKRTHTEALDAFSPRVPTTAEKREQLDKALRAFAENDLKKHFFALEEIASGSSRTSSLMNALDAYLEDLLRPSALVLISPAPGSRFDDREHRRNPPDCPGGVIEFCEHRGVKTVKDRIFWHAVVSTRP